jgi:hypothetical protein
MKKISIKTIEKVLDYNSIDNTLMEDLIREEKDLKVKNKEEKEKILIKYKDVILLYYNGNVQLFMEEKEKYRLLIDELFSLIKLIKERIINFSQFKRYKKIILELSILTDIEFDELIKEYHYNTIEDLYEAFNTYKNDDNKKRTNLNSLVCVFSVTAYDAHIKYAQNFDEFIKDIKSNE